MHFMRSVSFAIVALAASVFASPPTPNVGRSAVVNLRIEGADKTIFEGPIRTQGHNVHTTLGGTHHCDGTNNNTNPQPGPTCTSALDDAAKKHSFSFDGTFFPEFDDFLISSVDGEANTRTQFWALVLNFRFAPVGGCEQQVKQHDEVLWAFDGFSKAHLLKLTGPKTAKVNTPTTFVVTDGKTGQAVQGATVNGKTSGADGKVRVTFGKVGINGVKAEKSDSIRSNQVEVRVTP